MLHRSGRNLPRGSLKWCCTMCPRLLLFGQKIKELKHASKKSSNRDKGADRENQKTWKKQLQRF